MGSGTQGFPLDSNGETCSIDCMTHAALKVKANRALRLASTGTTQQIDSFENAEGCSLSSSIDRLWAEADEQGDVALSRRLEAAYNHLTA